MIRRVAYKNWRANAHGGVISLELAGLRRNECCEGSTSEYKNQYLISGLRRNPI
jgi:hypothetical protein